MSFQTSEGRKHLNNFTCFFTTQSLEFDKQWLRGRALWTEGKSYIKTLRQKKGWCFGRDQVKLEYKVKEKSDRKRCWRSRQDHILQAMVRSFNVIVRPSGTTQNSLHYGELFIRVISLMQLFTEVWHIYILMMFFKQVSQLLAAILSPRLHSFRFKKKKIWL